MALTSSSTVADALAQYKDNLAWDGDLTKALAALEAVRFLLVNRPQSYSLADRSTNWASLERECERLQKFVEAAGGSAHRCHFVKVRPL